MDDGPNLLAEDQNKVCSWYPAISILIFALQCGFNKKILMVCQDFAADFFISLSVKQWNFYFLGLL